MKKYFKYLFILSILLTSTNLFASSNISKMKEQYKYDFITYRLSKDAILVRIGDRLEADALLELTEGYEFYDDFYNKKIRHLEHSDLTILIMPRIDILEKYWLALSKTTDKMLVFLMKNDKLDGVYGDRSYETYLAKNLEKKIPKNTKVYALEDDSVTNGGIRNNFEISDILKSKTYNKQIKNIYEKEIEKLKKKKFGK